MPHLVAEQDGQEGDGEGKTGQEEPRLDHEPGQREGGELLRDITGQEGAEEGRRQERQEEEKNVQPPPGAVNRWRRVREDPGERIPGAGIHRTVDLSRQTLS